MVVQYDYQRARDNQQGEEAVTYFVAKLRALQELVEPDSLAAALVAEMLADAENAHLSPRHQVVSAIAPEWRNPEVEAPPVGRKITVMTWGGIQTETVGANNTAVEFAAWAPLIDKPDWLTEKLQARYKQGQTPY